MRSGVHAAPAGQGRRPFAAAREGLALTRRLALCASMKPNWEDEVHLIPSGQDLLLVDRCYRSTRLSNLR